MNGGNYQLSPHLTSPTPPPDHPLLLPVLSGLIVCFHEKSDNLGKTNIFFIEVKLQGFFSTSY